jgi:glycolate oxidase
MEDIGQPAKSSHRGDHHMDIIAEITRIVGQENIFSDRVECLCYSRDMSVHQGTPDAVIFPKSTDHVSSIMKVAHSQKIPVTPRGTGTSVTGAVLPVRGGLLLDLHLMNNILEINKKDFYARVEPGVVCMQLNRILAQDNLMFPPNPGSEAIATIGGMVSTNASGHRSVKYGTTRDYLKGLKVVLADGTVIETGNVAPKTSLGYDMTHLFCAAEGTLGIITEVLVKLEPKPAFGALALAIFSDLNAAVDAVTEVTTSGIKLAGCEIMDKFSLKVVEKALGRDASKMEALLVMEADGAKEVVLGDMKKIEDICDKYSVQEFQWSDDPHKREEMMQARGRLVPTLSRIKPGNRLVPIAEDLGVPPSKIPETIRRAQAISEKHNVMIATFGHVGDGNIHTTFVSDVRDRDGWSRLKPAVEELVEIALEAKGTLSAEHGTGLTRAPHMEKQLGPAIEVMRKIKQALDPENILNPGKMALEKGKADIYDYFAFQPLIDHPEGVNSYGEDIDNEVLACIHCGFCRLGCPTFGVTHRESRNARGRNALAFYLLNGTIEPSTDLAEAFYSCTTCQTCTYFCPARIRVDEIVEGVRKKLYKAGFIPEPILAVRDNILKTGNVFASAREGRVEIYPAGLKEKVNRGELKTEAETLLFMGCVPSYLDMKMVPSLIKPLEVAGADYTTLSVEESCCGFPLYLMGSEEFESHARNLMARIRATGARELVTPCAGCFKTFQKIYPEIGDLEVEVYHSVHYLGKLIDEKRVNFDGELDKKVTYHDPCDLGRAFKIFEEPRNILKKLPGLQYVEMARNRLQARCCGGGGGVQANNPDMAVDMAVERVRDALAVEAEIIVSGCAACKDNLRKGAKAIPKKERGKIKIMDITEIVAGALE